MNIRRPPTYKVPDLDIRRYYEDIFKVLQQHISFGTVVNSVGKDQNIQGYTAEIADSGVANSSIKITHNLGYVPKFYDVKYISQSSTIFDFGTAWTKQFIYLASSTAHTKFRVFIH